METIIIYLYSTDKRVPCLFRGMTAGLVLMVLGRFKPVATAAKHLSRSNCWLIPDLFLMKLVEATLS